jgi:autotransporter-associated beta strand protein
VVHAAASVRLQSLILTALILGPLMAAGQALNITNGVQIYISLTNTTVTMSNRCELRVMATNNPIPGCTINLNSSNAWFLLSNIRPSAVSTGYLSQVFVNGAAAVAGSNCRVDPYAMGTVIIPHAPSFTPLQIFSGPNFIGASMQLGLYTYYTGAALGALNRNIGSFKLKRGYSATFAQNSDGTGTSMVFVAQDGDLEVGMLAASLNRPVSFVRVFPWRWTAKRGWDDTAGLGGEGAFVNPYWFYDWGNGRTSGTDAEYVPMQWGGGYSTGINSKQKSTEVLGFNEPDSASQANLTVAAAIANWPSMMQSGLRVGAPAVSDSGVSGQGLDWLYGFMSQATNLGYRVDFIPIHFYKCAWSSTQLSNYLAGVWQTTGKPIWLTEFNYGADWCSDTPTPALEASEITQFINVLESAPFVERYSVYNWVGTNRAMVLESTGTMTPAGIIYRDTPTTLSYKQTLPPGGSRSIAQFQFETNTLDSSGYGNNGFAVGIPGYTAGHTGLAVALDGTNSFLQLPPNVANSANFTFAAWVYWNGGAIFQRIFDFGNDTTHYLFLTPNSGSTLRFAIRNGGAEQIIETTAIPAGQWWHVAVTVSGSSAKLYTNGVLAASSSSITISPANFGPARNYLGKSQFPVDPLFSGNLDEVQIADYAFTAAQIASLLTNSPPQFTTNFMTRGSAAEGVAYSNNIIGTATDPDPGDTLVYSKAGGPAWLTANSDGTMTGTPGFGDGGTNYFTMRVTDAAGASAFAVVTISTTVISVSGVWGADASGNWSDATKWSGGAVANAAGYTADFSTLNIAADRTVTLDTPRSIGTLKFSDASGAQNWNLDSSGGSILTLDTGSAVSPSIVVTNTATISAPLAGVNGFTMTGSGTLILSNANTFTGNTRIASGTLTVAHTNALQASTVNMDGGDTGALAFGPITSANLGGLIGSRNLRLMNSANVGVALNLVGSGDCSYAGILSGTGSLVNNGSGTFTLTSPSIYTGGTIINAGTIKLSRDPVVRFSFNNAAGSSSGSVITNTGTGGSSLNGTIVGTGASVVSSGRYGNALSINGVGGTSANNIVIINSKGIATDAGGTWTLGCWIKTTTAGAVIMYQGDGTWSSAGQTAYLLNANSGSTAGTTAGAVRWAGGFLTGTTALNNGAWHFITLVDRAGTETIYVDGYADTVTSTMGLALSSLANQMWIGGAPDTDSGAVKINGLIDEVFLYNRALTQTEIQLLTSNTPAATSGNFGGQLPVTTALAIASGATFDLGGNSQTVASLADSSGGGIITNSGAAPTTLTLGGGSVTNTFSGVIADTAATNAISLVKNGVATEILSGANSFRGTTTVNNGTLIVNGGLGTNAVTVAGGKLGGNGVIGGPVTIQSGGTLSPGNATGLLTIINTLTLNGTTLIELNKAVPTNDVIQGISTVNYGGTLTVTNLGGTLALGDSFAIFYATNYNGSFAALNLPSLGVGLAWNTNALTNGTLSVIATMPRQFGSIAQSGDGNFQISGSGSAGVTYELDATTDLSPPITWLFVTNAIADQDGNFQLADLQATNFMQRFYRITASQ